MFTSETLTLVWNFFLIFFLKKKLFGHVTQNNSPNVKMAPYTLIFPKNNSFWILLPLFILFVTEIIIFL